MTCCARYARALLFLVLGFSASGHTAHAAESFPAKPLRLIVPYPAGGLADTLARLVAAGLTTRLGRQVVVDNRGGGGGTIGVDIVLRNYSIPRR